MTGTGETPRPFAGRVAFVTAAAGKGIGRATAHLLAARGARVVVTDHSERRAAETAEEIATTTGVEVLSFGVDVTNTAQVDAAIEDTVTRWGGIDVLVNNAGISEVAPIWETSLESWQRVIDVSLTGHFRTIRTVLPHMISRRSGVIVNIASIEAWTSRTVGNTAYHAAKAGVLALTRSTALQVAPYGIRVNGVAPGLVPNPGLRHVLEADHIAQLEAEIPLGRGVDPSEIASAIAFLASPEASSITGETIAVSGGAHMRA